MCRKQATSVRNLRKQKKYYYQNELKSTLSVIELP